MRIVCCCVVNQITLCSSLFRGIQITPLPPLLWRCIRGILTCLAFPAPQKLRSGKSACSAYLSFPFRSLCFWFVRVFHCFVAVISFWLSAFGLVWRLSSLPRHKVIFSKRLSKSHVSFLPKNRVRAIISSVLWRWFWFSISVSCTKLANKACTRRVGVGAIYMHFSGFEFFLF